MNFMNNIKEKFQGMIRRILMEELETRDSVVERVPVMDGNGNDTGKKHKTFGANPNSRDRKSKDQLLADLGKIVNAIDSSYPVVWDDHDDLRIDAKDLIDIRITPDWEDHYDVEVMTRSEDRLWVTGLDWEQVKDFVKKNLSPANKNEKPTGVEKAYDKSYRNMKDQTDAVKELPKSDKVKVKKVSDSSNKNKDFNEKQNKEDDNPDKPMREVGKVKRQEEFKVKDPVKLRKRTPDKKLVVKS